MISNCCLQPRETYRPIKEKGHAEKTVSCPCTSGKNKTGFNTQFLGPIKSDVLPVTNADSRVHPLLQLFTTSSGIKCANDISFCVRAHGELSHFTTVQRKIHSRLLGA